MPTVTIQGRLAHASDQTDDHYYLVGVADDEVDYEQYVLFQRGYGADGLPGPDDRLHVECNGDQCVDCVVSARLTESAFEFVVDDVTITVDLTGCVLPGNFVELLSRVLGDRLVIGT